MASCPDALAARGGLGAPGVIAMAQPRAKGQAVAEWQMAHPVQPGAQSGSMRTVSAALGS